MAGVPQPVLAEFTNSSSGWQGGRDIVWASKMVGFKLQFGPRFALYVLSLSYRNGNLRGQAPMDRYTGTFQALFFSQLVNRLTPYWLKQVTWPSPKSRAESIFWLPRC